MKDLNFNLRKPNMWLYRYFVIILLCVPLLSSEQLWQGNVGLPILTMDFGSGQSKPLPANTTNFLYNTGCPNAGEHSLEHFLIGCTNHTWYY